MNQPRSGWVKFEQLVKHQLQSLLDQNRLRTLCAQTPEVGSPFIAGSIDLTHNDYLGLRVDQQYRQRAHQASTYLPPGSGASRLLGGELPVFAQLEDAFSRFKQCEASLYFGSGYAANEAVATCIAIGDVAIFSDELNHASIIDGLKLSRLSKERRIIYPHLDFDSLANLLANNSAALKFIYTESLFSMDGDVAALDDLTALAEEHGAILVIDEAHAIGVRGPQGRGLIAEFGLKHDHLISINTCGKALAAQGALVSGPSWFMALLVNCARSFIYTTGPSPWMAAALLESLAIVQERGKGRHHLNSISELLRRTLRSNNIDIGQSTSHILPLIVGSESKALAVQAHLEKHGVLAKAIRPPTVAEGKCRVRLSLNSLLSVDQINHIANIIDEAFNEK